MKVSAFSALFSAVLCAVATQASSAHIHKGSAHIITGPHRRHAASVQEAAAPLANRLTRRKGNGRCKPRPASSVNIIAA